jgi:DNA sulfur modification protein DndC
MMEGGFNIKFQTSKNRLVKLAEEYKHWIIMYSGGKDSTTALITSFESLLDNKIDDVKIDVIYSDTMVEIPSMYNHAIQFIASLKSLERLRPLNIDYHITKPKIEDSFWVCMLGKGYPVPKQRFRWCTKRLKIEPAKKIIRDIASCEKVAIITGVRYNESLTRDRRLQIVCSRGGECGQGIWLNNNNDGNDGNGSINNNTILYFAPIIDWNECDVWDFLNYYAPTLGYPTSTLERLYNGRETRFGCWVCTVVKQDKALERTVELYPNLRPLLEFRKYLLKISEDPNNRYVKMDGSLGRLSLEARRTLLASLLKLQEETGLKLISEEEIEKIKYYWVERKYLSYE